jgi:hypothetical protein
MDVEKLAIQSAKVSEGEPCPSRHVVLIDLSVRIDISRLHNNPYLSDSKYILVVVPSQLTCPTPLPYSVDGKNGLRATTTLRGVNPGRTFPPGCGHPAVSALNNLHVVVLVGIAIRSGEPTWY